MKQVPLLATLVILAVFATAQTIQPIDKIKLEKKLDSLFRFFNNKNSPGYAITVLQNGKPVAKKDYGMASLEFKIPFTHNTVITLPYSEGREFISIAAVLMEEEGKLKLEDKVRKYFPQLPAWSDAVTIQDLLNHSSGFCDEWATLALTQASMNNRLDVSQFLNFLYRQPDPQVEPGKGYMYCNSDFGLLRLILDKVSGEPLPVYLKRKVFTPLKMYATSMQVRKDDMIPDHAFSYISDGDNGYRPHLRNKTSPGGNYWMLTSANDLEKWTAIHADGNSFISKAISRLKQHARPIPVLKGTSYVFGHKINRMGNYEVISHKGVSGYAYVTRIPSATISVICVSSYWQPYEEKIDELAKWLLQVKDEKQSDVKKFPSTAIALSKEELQQFTGYYRVQNALTFQSTVEKKSYKEFKLVGDSLSWVYTSDDIFAVMPVGKGIFKDPGFPVWLIYDQPHPDSVMTLEIHSQFEGNVDVEYLRKDTAARPQYSKESLQKITGRYYSPHLDFYWTIMLDDEGKLVLKRPTIADKYLEPGPDGEFMLKVQYYEDDESTNWIRFYYNAAGEVTHFNIWHPRLMHHRFDKVAN
ncbi:MAG: beta-lactamase family protein [Chitinophagaceae bacterium]|nr:beta-lactamase family protein [Chitinophagaceae bacterium]